MNIRQLPAPAAAAGFTLAEMLAALAILLFGVTALLGAIGSSIEQRRTTDARHELVALCEFCVQQVQERCVRADGDGNTPDVLAFEPLVDQPAPGFAGMTWSARTEPVADQPLVWLLHIEARWFEEGEPVTAEFVRVIPRRMSMQSRVQTFRDADPMEYRR